MCGVTHLKSETMLETLGAIIGLVLFLGPISLIVQKAGYSPFWVLLVFVPLVNLLALIYFAVTEWPIESERRELKLTRNPLLQQVTRLPTLTSDATPGTSWELQRLAKRVSMVEQFAASEGRIENVGTRYTKQMLDMTGQSASDYIDQTRVFLDQFLIRATHSDEKEFAENLLNTVRSLEAQIQHG